MIIFMIYVLPLLISVANLWILMVGTSTRKNSYYVMMFCVTVVSDIGYMFAAMATTKEAALLGTQLSYLNGTFVVFYLGCCMYDICNIKVKHTWLLPSVLINLEVILVVFTASLNKWHYKSYDIAFENGYAYLVKEYGWHHTFYMLVLVGNVIIPIGIILYSIRKKKQVSWIYTLLLGIGETILVILYFLERALGAHIELLPWGYAIVEILILIILHRMEIYDISRNVALTREQAEETGYAVVSPDLKFAGADDVAKKYFPELSNLSLDLPITDRFLREEFGKWIIESYDHSVEPKYFFRAEKDIKVTVQPFLHPKSGKHFGYVLQISDDTQNQQYIRALKIANHLSEEYAQKAEAANKFKSDFLSNMSHEIRTPINAVLGLNEMILRETDDPSIKSYAMDIRSSGNTMLSLINDLLDFQKIEAGKMALVEGEYNFAILLNDVVNMINVRAADKGLDFKVSVSEDFPKFLYGDEIRIKQVMVNILTNAVKYAKKGYASLKITYSKLDEQTIRMNVSVEDTGIGMKPETIQHLFARFERIEENKNKYIEGTGLGMAISKQILELMDSALDVQSTYGEGSTFSFAVNQRVVSWEPLGDYKETANKLKQNSQKYTASFTAPDAKVLVVDDTKLNITVIKGLLKQTKVQIEEARSGPEAIEKCKETKFDVILLDHMMPGMDGMETIKHIQEGPAGLNKDTPAIAMTANVAMGIRDTYLRAGFTDYISKPVDPQRLESLLEEILL